MFAMSHYDHHHPVLNILIFPNQNSAPTPQELKGAVSRVLLLALCLQGDVIPGACSFTHGPWPDEDLGGLERGWIILIPMEPGLLALWVPVITRIYMGESPRVLSTRGCLDKIGGSLWWGSQCVELGCWVLV